MARRKRPSLADIQTELNQPPENTELSAPQPVEIITAEEDEQQRLHSLEQVIESNLKAFYQVGLALKEIRDNNLYKLQGYSNFDDYCKERWEMRRAHAYRLIDSSTVMINLSPIGDKILPVSESQVRPLTRLSPDEQRQAWEKVIEAAPVVEDKPRVTAKLVEKMVSQVTGQDDEEKTEQQESQDKKFNYRLSLDEETNDLLSETFHKIRRLVGKEYKDKVTKELVATVMLQTAMVELEGRDNESIVAKILEIIKN